MSAEVELIVDYQTLCGEGPVWDFRRSSLVWDDLSTSRVFQYHPATGESAVISTDVMAAGIALNGENGLVFAGSGGLHTWQPDGSLQTLHVAHNGIDFFFNDIIAGPGGCVYGNTVYFGENGLERPGKIYRFAPDGTVTIEDDGITHANGFSFSPDDRTLYMAETIDRVIYAYDVDPASGALSNRRTLITIPTDEGLPDGLTVDSEGFLWNAQWYGSQVVRYDPEGKVERRIPVPAKQISSVMFGGDALTDLYITTAAESWSSQYAPPGYDAYTGLFGGPLYRVRTEIQGRREHIADL